MSSRPLVINKVKVWFDDGTSGRIERGPMYVYQKDRPDYVGKTINYWPKGFNKRIDDKSTKTIKESIRRKLWDFMNEQNKDFKK